MKTGTVKLMTLITTAVLGTFSAGTVLAAENNDFYTQPPADVPAKRQIRKVLMQAIRMEVIM